jgi:serine/threonine protein kinase
MAGAARFPRLQVACCAQEAQHVNDSQQAIVTFGFDIWQLGMLIYEVHAGRPYWAAYDSDAAVLDVLLDPAAKLPHEVTPIQPVVFQKLLSKMMTRSVHDRLTAAQADAQLRAELTHEMPNHTMNAGEVHDETPHEIVL